MTHIALTQTVTHRITVPHWLKWWNIDSNGDTSTHTVTVNHMVTHWLTQCLTWRHWLTQRHSNSHRDTPIHTVTHWLDLHSASHGDTLTHMETHWLTQWHTDSTHIYTDLQRNTTSTHMVTNLQHWTHTLKLPLVYSSSNCLWSVVSSCNSYTPTVYVTRLMTLTVCHLADDTDRLSPGWWHWHSVSPGW